jgi:hypothetical protein
MSNLKYHLRSRLVELSVVQYRKIRNDYYDAVHGIIHDYMTNPGSNYRGYQTKMRDATVASYVASAKVANKKTDDKWMKVKIALVLLFLAKLWEDLWQIKRSRQLAEEEVDDIAMMHARNYAIGLDGVYGEANVRRSRNRLLKFDGMDGKPPEFPCQTCDSLKGQIHPASWWVENDLVPYQGNQNYSCGCWGCKHGLFDAKTGKACTL